MPLTLKFVLIYSGVALVLILILNAFFCRWLRSKNKSDDFAGKMSIVYFLGLIIVVVKLATTDFDSLGREYIAEKQKPIIQNSWSNVAIETARDRVLVLISNNDLLIEPHLNKAYINPLIWERLDVAKKKELMLTLIVYSGDYLKEEINFFEVYNKQTGQMVAEWNTIGDFSFEP